ncbi:laminin subunit alpha-2-like [Saccostrea cucullata]|uniref:laminin subunit alpha-2-like n=1 Tax=Saccostrea cuccullata TaxID=36930 RepID=UPI002ED2F2C0
MRYRNILMIYMATSIHACYGYRQLVIPGETEASQSSTYNNYTASRAIDGNPSLLSLRSGSCSHTGMGKQEAWLRIDLEKVFNEKYFKFWYRNDHTRQLENTIRLHGYHLQHYYDGWRTCYQDRTPVNELISMPSIVECPIRAKHLRFYTNTQSPMDRGQAFLEICEVEVYGCDVNQYGENCTECGKHCDICHIVYGCVKCQSGGHYGRCKDCKPGFSGEYCQPCPTGWYGYNCSQSCSGNCLNSENCDRVTGSCPSGCVSGYRGDNCLQQCSQGKYGYKCNKTCNTCKDMICNHDNGSCSVGCTDGWTGELCDESEKF